MACGNANSSSLRLTSDRFPTQRMHCIAEKSVFLRFFSRIHFYLVNRNDRLLASYNIFIPLMLK